MKKKFIGIALCLALLVVVFSLQGKSLNHKIANRQFTTSTVCFWASEHSQSGQFIVTGTINNPICEDVTIEGTFKYNNGNSIQPFEVTIPAYQSDGFVLVGTAPPGATTEQYFVTSISLNSACGVDIEYCVQD